MNNYNTTYLSNGDEVKLEYIEHRNILDSDKFLVTKITESKIDDVSTAYDKFIENWDYDSIRWIKEYKGLVLNDKNTTIYEISFKTHVEILDEEIEKFVEVAKSLPKASKLVIGLNRPQKSMNPSPEQKRIAKRFEHYGKDQNIPILEQMVIANNGAFIMRGGLEFK